LGHGFEAGKDLTDALANDAPHDDSNLDGFPVVGTLVD
jgi:predicted heme/steroid binding protein